jgi:DNA uptake protein ComE-like DNA-binding protein
MSIDLNKATAEQLKQSLPSIGDVLAARIVAEGPYKSVDDLKDVKGISASVFSKIKGLVCVNAARSERKREPNQCDSIASV